MTPSKLANAFKCDLCGKLFDRMGPGDGGAIEAPYTFQGIVSYQVDKPKLLCPTHHRELRGRLLLFWSENKEVD